MKTKHFLIILGVITVGLTIYGSYRIGHIEGCWDVIEEENKLGVNGADRGIGLSPWAWCDGIYNRD